MPNYCSATYDTLQASGLCRPYFGSLRAYLDTTYLPLLPPPTTTTDCICADNVVVTTTTLQQLTGGDIESAFSCNNNNNNNNNNSGTSTGHSSSLDITKLLQSVNNSNTPEGQGSSDVTSDNSSSIVNSSSLVPEHVRFGLLYLDYCSRYVRK